MDWASVLMKGFALFGAGYVAWYAGKYGWGAVSAGVSKVVSVVKTDLVALEQRVKNLEDGNVVPVPQPAPVSSVVPTPVGVHPPAPLPAVGSSTG